MFSSPSQDKVTLFSTLFVPSPERLWTHLSPIEWRLVESCSFRSTSRSKQKTRCDSLNGSRIRVWDRIGAERYGLAIGKLYVCSV